MGQDEFRKLVSVGYLGFNANSVFYSPDLSHMDDETICFIKLSDVAVLTVIRPAVHTASGWMIPNELAAAAVLIAGMVKPWKR